MTPQLQPASRLAYIDWMRGLACVLMFQTHCYNSWLTPEARKSALYAWSQLGGTLPAPLFIFLAGISFALVTQKLLEKGATRGAIAKTTILRGAEIFGLGLLFRVQEFILGYKWVSWTDLFRVDVLNILGLSMILMGVLCWFTASRSERTQPNEHLLPASPQTIRVAASRDRAIGGALAVAAFVALMTPLLWTSARLSWLPWPLESYLNGVHAFGRPQPWLFPLFPWSAFAFAGLAVGFLLFSDVAKRKEAAVFACIAGIGVLACALSLLFDAGPIHLYSPAIYDYWHTSPNFFLMRCGILLLILFCSLHMVPLGPRAKRLQPHRSIRQDLSAGLLGAHRICLRTTFHLAERAVQHRESHGRIAGHFSVYVSSVDLAYAEKTAR